MNYIEKFLQLTNQLPREFVRYLKLLRDVEGNFGDLKNKLKKSRESYLENLKKNSSENSLSNSLKDIEKYNKEILELSDYKLEIVKELEYIIESTFLDKLSPIIDEGKKELNNLNRENNFSNNKNIDGKLSDINNNIKKEKEDIDTTSVSSSQFLGKKKDRMKSSKKKSNILSNKYSEEIKQSKNGEIEKYCKCNGVCFGKMIECDNPNCEKGQWFHLSCVGIKEGEEPDSSSKWFCCKKCEKDFKKVKNQEEK